MHASLVSYKRDRASAAAGRSEDEVRVAVHVELHEGCLLVEAPVDELSGDGAPRRT